MDKVPMKPIQERLLDQTIEANSKTLLLREHAAISAMAAMIARTDIPPNDCAREAVEYADHLEMWLGANKMGANK